MDIVIDSGKFSATQINKINYCRVYLSVHTISDITKANGMWLHPEFLTGTNLKYLPTNQQGTILQQRPGPASWKLWKRSLYLFSSKSGKLHKPLGEWLIPPTK